MRNTEFVHILFLPVTTKQNSKVIRDQFLFLSSEIQLLHKSCAAGKREIKWKYTVMAKYFYGAKFEVLDMLEFI